MITYRNRYKSTISNAAGTGDLIISTAVAPNLTWVTGDDGLTFDVTISEGSTWEVRKDCVFTFSTMTLSRGTLVNSSSGSAISFTSAAVVSDEIIAERILPVTITTPTTGQVIQYNGTNFVNATISSGGSSSVDLVSYSYFGGL